MPEQAREAIEWALAQKIQSGEQEFHITVDDSHLLVDKVREYFNAHGIQYSTFSYDDLIPYLPAGE